jgi:hypothetical protein
MHRLPHFLLALLLLSGGAITLQGQDEDLMSLLEAEEEPLTDYTFATFKSSRIINGHSVETHGKKTFQLLIGHRFGRVNSGFKELFGLDNSTIRIGLEYGIIDRLDIGLGRSSFEKTYDGFIKYKILQQSSGARKMPFTVTGLATTAIKTNDWPEPERPNYFSARVTYTFQLLIARKFNDYLSLQLSPTVVHRNMVATRQDHNTVFVMGFGGRVKLTGSLAINAEYYWIIPNQIYSTLYGEKVHDSFSIGIDLETGGHVFQLHFTNSRSMINKGFATETTGRWLDGDIHFGFNISRVFTVGGRDKKGRSEKHSTKPETE